jgi:ATP-dependent RNA helicase DBP3
VKFDVLHLLGICARRLARWKERCGYIHTLIKSWQALSHFFFAEVPPPPDTDKMAKRTLDDTELADGEPPFVETISRKKSKKEKRQRTESNVPTPDAIPLENEGESKAERKERKRLKKLKKAAESGEEAEVTPEVQTALSNGDEKAAKKAEKSRIKALKKAKEAEAREETETVAISSSTPITNGSAGSYIQDPALTGLPQSQIDKFLADNFITITDPKSASFRPITNFSYLPITDEAQRAPFKDFKSPTPIQAAAWPFLLDGRDVIGVAETGSGKTMAFAVPCVRAICSLPKSQRNKGVRAVIVSPTRELAMQSYEQIMKLAKPAGLQAVCVYGGVPKDQQRRDLKTADIVIATPGRLVDFIGERGVDLSKSKYVVLDEADRMLDKGFEEPIKQIINETPAIGKRQTLMFTATWPDSVRALAATFMNNPVKIAIGDNPDGDLRANTRITQKVEVVEPRNKEYRLMQLLKQYQSGDQKDDRILVFCLYKKEATRVEQFIRQKGFRVVGIHGDLSQEQRTRSLDAFKKGQTPILVATDVAARGLDIPAVKLVINCTFPLTVEDYVHRIGRTGRAGKDGLAITLFTEHDKAQSGG